MTARRGPAQCAGLCALSRSVTIPENAAPVRTTLPMKDSIRQRLEKMNDRFEEVGRLLATDVAGGSQQFRDLSMEYARLEPLAQGFRGYRQLETDRAAAQDLATDPDPQMQALGT